MQRLQRQVCRAGVHWARHAARAQVVCWRLNHQDHTTFGTRHRSGCRSFSSEGQQPLRVSNKDLEVWANDVRGHAYSRACMEPYTVSTVRHFGKGVESPDGWSAHFISTSGLKSSGVPNQDAYSFTTLQCGWILCIACDGHGDHGEIIAERVSRALPLFFSSYLVHGTEEALRRAFQSAQNDLESSFGPMQVYSGATVVMCCIDKDAESVWCAHAGDSRLVVGDMDTGQPVFCSIEHKAHDAEEYKRLEAAGAQVIQKRYDDGEVVSRIFIPKTGVPGLAMSRSMGDGCLKKYGVTAEPDISNITDSWKSCALPGMIMGSDGLWDTVSPEEACSTISDEARYRSKRDVQAGLENLTRRSQRRWIEAEGDYCDDVTVAFVAPLAAEAAA